MCTTQNESITRRTGEIQNTKPDTPRGVRLALSIVWDAQLLTVSFAALDAAEVPFAEVTMQRYC